MSCMINQFFFLCLVVYRTDSRPIPKDCVIDLDIIGNKETIPLVFYESQEYIIPFTKAIKLMHNTRVTLSCPGIGNYLTLGSNNLHSVEATCIEGKHLRVDRKVYSFKDLLCHKALRGDIKQPGKSCANNKGNIQEIGYKGINHYWNPMIRVCYNEATGVAFYTEHILFGGSLKHVPAKVKSPNFDTKGIPFHVDAPTAFKISTQKTLFSKLLGINIITDKNFLSKGHLSPAGDFLAAFSKRATYYYINVCPQWQSINEGNWGKLENKIRNFAHKRGINFRIITGTFEVATLLDQKRNPHPLYLEQKESLPVPQLIYKILYEDNTKHGIAFVVVNNPFQKNTDKDQICEDICDKYGWGESFWKKPNKGFLYCCDLQQFLRIVKTTPLLLEDVRGVLTS